MRFLIDQCAGRRLADWLRKQGHDVKEVRERDPGLDDQAVLARAFEEVRVLVTMDNDFGDLVFVDRERHAGIVRLPDVPVEDRIVLIARVVETYALALSDGVIVPVQERRIRVSTAPDR